MLPVLPVLFFLSSEPDAALQGILVSMAARVERTPERVDNLPLGLILDGPAQH